VNVGTYATSLFAAIVFFGALVMVVKSPQAANALVSAGVGSIANTTRAFEGRPLSG
jgi:hypothetical protein